MTAGQRKPEGQWAGDARKDAKLDQRLKSLIMSVLPDDQMNSVINFLTTKSTWDDLILYQKSPCDVKESRVMDLKLCYNTFKFKEAKYNKVKAKLALLSSSASSPKSSSCKNKGLIFGKYEWDEEDCCDFVVIAIEVKALMALANEERVFVSKESASNGEWVKIFIQKHPFPPLQKLAGAKSVPGPKTVKLNLKSSPTFKIETLKGITSKEPSLAPAKDYKKGSLVLKTYSAPAGKLKNVKVDDDPPLAIVMKELNELKLQLSKKKSTHFKNHQPQQRTDHRTCDHAELMSSLNTSQHHTGQGESSLRSRPSRRVISFPSCIHYGYNDHQFDDSVYYPRIHVDDIILGSTNTKVCKQFAKLMTQRYEMSMIGVLAYFLRFQTKKSERGISINKEIYVKDLLKKYDRIGSSENTPIVPLNMLGLDLNGKAINETQYREIHVDDIILGSTNTKVCKQFAKLMTQRYEMSMIGVLAYFLRFQTKKSERGISINKEIYVKDLLKKYDRIGSSENTPIVPLNMLGLDLNGKAINETQYRGMI
nr:uncharacterized mitochondrial protein AtMg00810-like [Tanacetum cinerariifolium]